MLNEDKALAFLKDSQSGAMINGLKLPALKRKIKKTPQEKNKQSIFSSFNEVLAATNSEICTTAFSVTLPNEIASKAGVPLDNAEHN